MKFKKTILAGVIGLGVLAASGCAAFDSSMKDFESNTSGLDRKVTVYSKTGKVLHTYEGIIRTKSSEESNNVVFELDGKRIVIYNADVVIEEN
ncbi:hypothetical protein BVL54_19825 [Bacillus paralicheniformis]|nr:hypothetical protein BVL54_19825 [Bacillus paralicheniformis]